MNSLHTRSEKTIQKRKFTLPLGYAAAVLLALSACSPKEKEKAVSTPQASSSTPLAAVQDNFCHDISSAHFDLDVRKKIHTLQQEIPQLASLLAGLESVPNSAIHFFDRKNFISFLQKNGTTITQAQAYIRDAGAMTFIPDKKTQTEETYICIYLSPYALSNKNNFIEGTINELLNAYMTLQLPNELEVKQRAPDERGGLDISEKEMRGIGIEFAKEYMSGLMSTLIREQYQKKDIRCSTRQLRDNLRKGIFWHTDSPNYAFEYFYDILRNHGFPVERNDELIKLYTFCIDVQWADISRNVVRMGKGLNLPITDDYDKNTLQKPPQ